MDCGKELDEIPEMNFALILAAGFLFLKTGEKFATQESAGPTVALLTTFIGQQTGTTFEPRVLNDPAQAEKYCTTGKPTVGIVTPGFYLAYGKMLGMEPVLEIKRQQVAMERYVLVTKGTVLDALADKTIATPLALEPQFVAGVILQNRLGAGVRLQPITDVEGAVMDLVEGAKNAPAAVLMEEGIWQVIHADAELGPQVKAVFTSDELPGNLVVTFGGKGTVGKLKDALKATPAEILSSIRVETFSEVNMERLKKAEERFCGK